MIKNRLTKNPKYFISVFIAVLFIITTLISVGFSALNIDLNIAGDIEYDEHDDSPTLYNVLKNEARLGTYAGQYTGDHNDSFTEQPTKKIYYWYGSNDTNANLILDKWNVIVGGFCWQMIRTTDTGGVKLLYNGVPSSGKCNNTGTAQQIGKSKFNTLSRSLTNVGYMFNTEYRYNEKDLGVDTTIFQATSMTGSSNYYYGTGITYSGGMYRLTGTTQATWTNTYSSSSGLYTCASTTATQCSTAYYIVGGGSNYMYGFKMTGGNMLSYYNTNITFGTEYTESGGTYTLSNPTTITKLDWWDNYNLYKNYYTCGNSSTSCTVLYCIYSSSGTTYWSTTSNDIYLYANNFTYNNGNNTYTLGSDRIATFKLTGTDLSTHHYTCMNMTGECNTLAYVFEGNYGGFYYLNLDNGKSIEDLKNEMLFDDNVNTTPSTIKTFIDDWYSSNLVSYTSYFEDAIFCNNRSLGNESTCGWNPNGGLISQPLIFNFNSLQCINDTDKFSVANNKAKLTYPVGLPIYAEMNLLNNNNLTKTGQQYWLGTPFWYRNTYSYERAISSTGGSAQLIVSSGTYGVRPVVSLKPDTEYVSGTGSRDNPYIVQ